MAPAKVLGHQLLGRLVRFFPVKPHFYTHIVHGNTTVGIGINQAKECFKKVGDVSLNRLVYPLDSETCSVCGLIRATGAGLETLNLFRDIISR